MIRTVYFDPETQSVEQGGSELIDRWEQNPQSLIWAVIEGEDTETESNLLTQRFGVHKLAVTDALRDRHPPKIEPFENTTFIILKGLDATTESLEFKTIQISLFISERSLVTRSSARSLSTEAALNALLNGDIKPGLPRAALALKICRFVADRFVKLLLSVETRLEDMEDEMLRRPNDRLLGELVQQKGSLKRMLRVLEYDAQVFAIARSETPKELDGHSHELNDVHEQLDRSLSLARLYYELTDDLMQGYLSLSSHRLNQIMQTLTIVTVIFVPITFMAGIYGMNFKFIPELGFRYGYFTLLGAMLLVVSGILIFFRARGFLGDRGGSPGRDEGNED